GEPPERGFLHPQHRLRRGRRRAALQPPRQGEAAGCASREGGFQQGRPEKRRSRARERYRAAKEAFVRRLSRGRLRQGVEHHFLLQERTQEITRSAAQQRRVTTAKPRK